MQFISIEDQEALRYKKFNINRKSYLILAKNIDYYSYSFEDFKGEKNLSYENIPNLCKKYKIKKNLINPIYIS